MPFVLVAMVLLTVTPAMAGKVTFPISIPSECFELAQREGVPTVIENKYQAAKAKLKLDSLKKSDHLVRECRAAVANAKRVAEQSGTYVDKK